MKFLKKNRLVSKADYQLVFDQPTKFSQQYLQVLSRANALGYPRLGIIINKSNAPSAVDRNRLRRIIRESFRVQLADLPSLDIIVFIKRNWEKDSKILRSDVDKLWTKF